MSVPGQHHFYCSEIFVGSWVICESRVKKKNIDGHFAYSCESRYKAYKLAKVLNAIYDLDYSYLFLFRSFCCSSSVCEYSCALSLAETILCFLDLKQKKV